MLSSTSSLAIHGIGVKLTAYIHSVLIGLLIDSFGRAKHWNFWFCSWKRTSIFAREQYYRKIFYIFIFCKIAGLEYPKWNVHAEGSIVVLILVFWKNSTQHIRETQNVNTSQSCFIQDKWGLFGLWNSKFHSLFSSLLYGCWLVMKLELNLKCEDSDSSVQYFSGFPFGWLASLVLLLPLDCFIDEEIVHWWKYRVFDFIVLQSVTKVGWSTLKWPLLSQL